MMPQLTVPAVLMRGGTSRGLFFHTDHLPPAGPERDRVLLEVLGSPDPGQIDGLGGATSSTSKVMLVSRSERPGCDVDYLFGQASVTEPVMDYRANCGNLTSAVAPFAIDEGLVGPFDDGPVTVTLFNLNTQVTVEVSLTVIHRRAAVQGDHVIAGVPRPGSRIEMQFMDPAGAVLGRLQPTGNAVDVVEYEGGALEVSIVDVANPSIFIRAADLGLTGSERPADANADSALLVRLEALRGRCAALVGLVDDPEDAARISASVPTVVLCSRSEVPEADVRVRVLSVQRMHHACPMTALMCTTVAAALPGTVVSSLLAEPVDETLTVEHPKGLATARARLQRDRMPPVVSSVGVTRTARRLMAGEIYLRA